MYLKTLTVRGFKSFASATTFEFEPGVTAVVGPNGSGKSNVVDALAWVMGEQGAKTLRGGKMEDVIFAGTAGRQALGRAQVSLTIDNSDGALPIEYTEVTISRTLFRAGGSEYAINGSPARLLDIQELLSDSGLGREMHVIVGQGQLDRILHATPEERRGFIEEAAGILKHRRRKEKTLRKLEATQANLDRLQDLVKELARQLKPLGRQAELARRARTVQATVRDARARLLADELSALRGERSRADAAASELDDARERAERENAEAAAHVRRLEADIARQAPAAAAARTTWYDLSRLDERFAALGALAAERRRLLGAPEPPRTGGDEPENLRLRAERTGAEATAAELGVRAAREALERAGVERGEAEQAQRSEDARLTAVLRAVADRREGLARLAGQVGAARQRLDSAEGERLRAAQAQRDAVARHAEASRGLEEAADRAQRAQAALNEPAAAVRVAKEGLSVARDATQAAAERVGPLAEARAAAAARVAMLREGLPEPDDVARLVEPYEGSLRGSLADALVVEPGYEAAVQAALEGAERALVAADRDTLVAVAEAAARGGGVHLRLLWPLAPDEKELPTSVRPVLDVVTADAAVVPLLMALLGGVVLAGDDREALALVERHALVAVTMAGHRWGATGVAFGDAQGAAALGRRAAFAAAEAELGDAASAEALAREAAAAARPLHDEAQRALSVAEAAMREASEAARKATGDLERVKTSVSHALQEAERFAGSEDRAGQAVAEAEATLAELTARLEAAQAVPDEAEPSTRARDELAAAASAARAAEVDARLAVHSAEENARALRDRERSLLRAAETEQRARDEAAKRAARRAARARRADEVGRLVDVVRSQLQRKLEAARRAVGQAEEAERHRAAELEFARAGLARAVAAAEQVTEASHRLEVEATQRAGRMQALAERALSELSMTPDHLVEHFGPQLLVPPDEAGQDKWAALREEVDEDGAPLGGTPYVRAEQEVRLKRAERALAELGKVNPLALEEFAALEERHDYLSTQLEDLRSSRKDLLDLVREVDDHVRGVFAEAYADTAREFERVFERLFPGGEGRLRLTDPQDMLTTGIEVEARPAGKKVKRLSLLSGGERSLTAIALLVAIFTARPSPFYVMDEVEAALDERNLLRLLSVFSDLRERSQLIIITHQKHTMDIADALYGVSMRGDGITQVISQRVNG